MASDHEAEVVLFRRRIRAASLLAPQLLGLTEDEAQSRVDQFVVDHDVDITVRFLPVNKPISLEGSFGRIDAWTSEGRVVEVMPRDDSPRTSRESR